MSFNSLLLLLMSKKYLHLIVYHLVIVNNYLVNYLVKLLVNYLVKRLDFIKTNMVKEIIL